MVNDKHYAWLMKGVQVWNEWRDNNPEIIPDLSEAELSEADLSGADLDRANLRDADLSEASLKDASLRDADLHRAYLYNAYLDGANLIGANLGMAHLSGVNLIGFDFSEADLSGANLIETDLSFANLIGADLSGADLSGADLSGANLSGANLSGANLSGANLSLANFSRANLSLAVLSDVDISGANLNKIDLEESNRYGLEFSRPNLSGANLGEVFLVNANIKYANLSSLDFSSADFTDADVSYSNLSEANLSGAKLVRTQALRTNFTAANFTGACLEDWHINSHTKLDSINCQYVYWKSDKQERRPSSGEFSPGEFNKLFQKALETVDLIFADGIDWQAFLTSFQKLQVECGGEELFIQAIENKNDGAFVIRVNVPCDANKAEIENYLKREYDLALVAVEEKYKFHLQAKDEQIAIYRQQNTDLTEIVKSMAKRPIQNIIEVTGTMTNNQGGLSVGGSVNSNLNNVQGDNNKVVQGDTTVTGDRNINTGGGNYNERIERDYIQGNYYAAGQPQSLAQAAAEIQQLLKQLEQTYPSTTTSQQMVVAAEAINRIESNPTLKIRVINAVKEGGLAAFEKAIDNPAGAFIVGAIKGWQEVETKD
ncbi:MAG TPA: pentapeptide repeat-containing protein [Nostoc sp.]|uniref:pentapeptide repeat-containing protein n=1 Tax=Nostoc sp. TaxID=1180 RepID=UPI002D54D562|nr:pentapeptide repeat-containing protein [Nostoc sp.]HYX17730.1 pentapeptide repeat-containing protein [Nostoc sp.]